MYTEQEPLGNHVNCQGKVHSEILFRKKILLETLKMHALLLNWGFILERNAINLIYVALRIYNWYVL